MRAIFVLSAGSWDAATARDTVLLDWDLRYRRRIALRTEAGAALLLDLPEAARLGDGDGLMLAEGGIVCVRARPEPLLEVRAPPHVLTRISWHLGNRHLPVQVLEDCLRVRDDPVISDMVQRLGGQVSRLTAPFDPESGAYVGAIRNHGHHPHDHDEH